MTTGALSTNRAYGTATLLPNGKVLAAGGFSTASGILTTAELYDPATGTWTPTGSLRYARYQHTATLLPNGKVLVAGGDDPISNLPVPVSELYDPATGTWTAQGPLSNPRAQHMAILLPSGKVMIAGGSNAIDGLASAELYNPATGLWTWTGSLNTARRSPTAILLLSGKVMIAAGYNAANGMLSSAELYDPLQGTWSGTGYHSSAELYDSATGTWAATGSMSRADQLTMTSTMLADGRVMVLFSDSPSVDVYSYPPIITTQPANVAINQGRRATFSVTASGGDLSYQWQKDTVDIPNEHGATLTLDNVQAGDVSSYRVVVSNTTGSVTSNPATLTVYPDADGDGLTDAAELNTYGTDTNKADSDGDGLGDYEEVFTYSTNPNLRDSDSDGFLDGYEVLTGKSPLDPQDKPAMVAEARTAIEFTFPSALGKSYRIEGSPDLSAWSTVENGIAGNGGVIQRFYSTRNAPKKFLRVEEEGTP